MLGFMFDREMGGDGENLFLEQIPLPNPNYSISYGSGVHTKNAKISLKGFMDSVDKSEFWSYDGSLTTPPCTEGIKWTVFSDIQPISQAQLDAFKALWGQYGNARATQPLNGRDLRLVSPVSEKSKEEEVAQAAAVTFGVLFGIVTLTLIVVLALLFGKPACFNLEKTKKSDNSEKPADVPNRN